MYQKTLTLILAFATIFFLGYGITGFYSIDPSSYTLCVEDNACSYSVCCPVYNEDYGVCAQESECEAVYVDSQQSSGTVVSSQAPAVADVAERSYIALVLGVFFLLILAIVGYLEWKFEKAVLKKKRSKK